MDRDNLARRSRRVAAAARAARANYINPRRTTPTFALPLFDYSGTDERLKPSALIVFSLAIAFLILLLSRVSTPLTSISKNTLLYTGKLPLSWRWFYYRLPKIDERRFPEFRNILSRRRGVRGSISLTERVSNTLADFLNLPKDVRENGLAVKTKAFRKDRRTATYEASVHLTLVPHNTFLLQLVGVYRGTASNNVYMIMPRTQGDVSELISLMPTHVNLRLAAAEMAYAVYILHHHGFVHRDLKPENFLVGFDGHLLLADFEGFGVEHYKTLVYGTLGYRAPEVRRLHHHTASSDIYSLGRTYQRMQYDLKDVPIPDSALLTELIRKMTRVKAELRPTIEEVLEDPYFASIDFTTIERKEQGTPFPDGLSFCFGDYDITSSSAESMPGEATSEGMYGEATRKGVLAEATSKDVAAEATSKGVAAEATAEGVPGKAPSKGVPGDVTFKDS